MYSTQFSKKKTNVKNTMSSQHQLKHKVSLSLYAMIQSLYRGKCRFKSKFIQEQSYSRYMFFFHFESWNSLSRYPIVTENTNQRIEGLQHIFWKVLTIDPIPNLH